MQNSKVKTCAFLNTLKERFSVPKGEYNPFAGIQKQQISAIEEVKHECA